MQHFDTAVIADVVWHQHCFSALLANNVLNGTARLAFQAARGYTGPVEFSLVATSCYGSPALDWAAWL